MMSFSNDNFSSPTKKNQEPHQDSSFMQHKETEKKSKPITSQETEATNIDEQVLKKSKTSTSQETQAKNVPPMNRDEQVLKSPSGGILGGNMGSQRDPIEINPTSGDFKNNNDESSYLNLEDSDAPTMTWLFQNPETQMGKEGYGTNTCDAFRHQSNISLGPFGSIKSMVRAQRKREEIKMIPTPRLWTIKKILKPNDVSPVFCCLRLLKSSHTELYFQKHLPEADFQNLVNNKAGIIVKVYDHDTKTTHEVCLALRSYQYLLIDNWKEAFVIRRGLREGQEIGLYWDTSDSMLHFTVLDYA